jgi:serine/threonine protein kinase
MSAEILALAGVSDPVILARGASGVVYRARRGGAEVAVKVSRMPLPVDAIRRLPRHRGIVRIDAVDPRFLVMECCGGGSYAGRRVDEAETVALGVALAGTLAAVHAAGVLHCDVAPSNILRRDSGEPVLGDWGSARLSTVEDTVAVSALTPAYTAPEIFRGAMPSAVTDVYALGATLRAVGVQLGAASTAVLDRATALDADDRFATAGELLSELGGLAARDRG